MTTQSQPPAAGEAAHNRPHPDGKKPAYAFDTPCYTPSAFSPGDGWRFLEHGERIEHGDQTATTGGTFKKPVWMDCAASVGRIVADTQKFRRRLPAPTSTPWEYRTEHGTPPRCLLLKLSTGRKLSQQAQAVGEIYAEEDAAFIVRACNSHAALVEFAETFLALMGRDDGPDGRDLGALAQMAAESLAKGGANAANDRLIAKATRTP